MRDAARFTLLPLDQQKTALDLLSANGKVQKEPLRGWYARRGHRSERTVRDRQLARRAAASLKRSSSGHFCK